MPTLRYPFRGILLLVLLHWSCSSTTHDSIQPNPGIWRFTLNLGEAELPFHMDLTSSESGWEGKIINAEERITVNEIERENDSFFIQMPIFNSIFRGKLISPTQIEGTYQDYSRGPDYMVPFKAVFGDNTRFQFPSSEEPSDISGRWKVVFSPDTEDEFPAIGIFKQNDSTATGTFLTETGDYRYLEGNVNGEQARFSAFDGSHAYLFRARLTNDTLRGKYYSGIHFQTNWYAVRNDTYSLSDPYELTYLKEGFDQLNFSFPDADSNMVSLDDPRFQDKVVIVQLMGSWCPNCMDESRYFAKLYDEYKDQGLEILALAYERQPEFDVAIQNIQRLREKLELDYEILIAGTSNKIEAAETLPMLNAVISFPTAIFLDKGGNIRKIHTGFYGPGTGPFYNRFVDETTNFIEKLLDEPS